MPNLVIALIEEGVSLAPIARATGLSIEDLAALPVGRRRNVADAEELGQMAAMLAWRALEDGMRILDEGSEAAKIRLITSIAGHPLRRMQTDTSKTLGALRGLLAEILAGGDPVIDEEEVDDVRDEE